MRQLTPIGYHWIQQMVSYGYKTIKEYAPDGTLHIRYEPVGTWEWKLVPNTTVYKGYGV